MQTYYATFPFGTRHMIGVDMLNMSSRWVEVRAMSRDEALSIVSERFGDTGWQLHFEALKSKVLLVCLSCRPVTPSRRGIFLKNNYQFISKNR